MYLDECKFCSHSCDKDQQPICTCPPGYVLADDDRTCIGKKTYTSNRIKLKKMLDNLK